MQKQPVSASRKQSPCTGQLWKEAPICSRDNPQCCTLSMAATQRTSATLKCPIHMGSRIYSECGGHWKCLQPSNGSRYKKDDCKETHWAPCKARPERLALPNPQLKQKPWRGWKAEWSGSSSALHQRAPPGLRFAVPLYSIRQSKA